jgi:hypothetical protein
VLILLAGAYELLLPIFDEHFDNLVVRNPCPITAAAFLDCWAELMVILIKSRSKHTASLNFFLPVDLDKGPAASSSLSRSKFRLQRLTELRQSDTDIALALRTRAVARCQLLNVLVVDLHVQQEQDGIVGSLDQLPQCHLDAISVMDETQRFVSDENMLATLRHTSSHELKYASRALLGWNPIPKSVLPSNPRESDYALALLGYSHGVAYTGSPGKSLPEQPLAVWIQMVQVAGSELSVSIHEC